MNCYLFKNIKTCLTLQNVLKKNGKYLVADDLSLKNNISIYCEGDTIKWIGSYKDFKPKLIDPIIEIDCINKLVAPGLIDCHTHMLFGGNRSHEYSMRLNGFSYQEIADLAKKNNALSGINYTAHKTLEFLENEIEILNLLYHRIERAINQGITTLEVKTGYALTQEGEIQSARILAKCKKIFSHRINIVVTFMPAHSIPIDFSSSEQYWCDVIKPASILVAQEGIIDLMDIFIEQGYFDTSFLKKMQILSEELRVPWRAHVDEFCDLNGAMLASELGAKSCDHLLYSNSDGAKALEKNNTVGVLLPGTAFFLGKKLANGKMFVDAGVKVAIASDYNPGSCYYSNLLQIAKMSAMTFQFNAAQIWSAVTFNAAHALNLQDRGVIKEGYKAHFSIFECESFEEILYDWDQNYKISTYLCQ